MFLTSETLMYQEVELDLLPPELRNPKLEARTYFQFEFQFLFPKIWSSGFLDRIASNQRVRVLNYEKFMDMTERKWCISCDGRWCTSHECPNSYLVFFNPFDRDDGDDEVDEHELKEQELEEETKEKIDQAIGNPWVEDGYFDESCIDEKTSYDHMLEGKSENIEEVPMLEGLKVLVDNPEQQLELDEESEEGEYQELEEKANGKIHHDIVCYGKKTENSDEVLYKNEGSNSEQKLEECVEVAASIFEGHRVFDDKPKKELEQKFTSAGEFFKTGSIEQFMERKVISCAYLSLFDRVKSDEKIHYLRNNLKRVAHVLFKYLFGFDNWYTRKVVPDCVRLYQAHLEYKHKLKTGTGKKIICSGVNTGCFEMSRFKFDPGGKMRKNWNDINYVHLMSCLMKPVCKKQRSEWEVVNFLVKAVNNKSERSVPFRFSFDPGGYANHLAESIAGSMTIRAFKETDWFFKNLESEVDLLQENCKVEQEIESFKSEKMDFESHVGKAEEPSNFFLGIESPKGELANKTIADHFKRIEEKLLAEKMSFEEKLGTSKSSVALYKEARAEKVNKTLTCIQTLTLKFEEDYGINKIQVKNKAAVRDAKTLSFGRIALGIELEMHIGSNTPRLMLCKVVSWWCDIPEW